MLVLTRKKNVAICIGANIEITILDIQGEQIKLGIKAPDHIDVFRKEILDKIKAQNKEALHFDVKNLPKIHF